LEHLGSFRRFDRNVILDTVKEQLAHAPTEETKNRRSLRQNPVADWELRIGRHRVFYEVDGANRVVRIVAVGTKEGNRLIIGGKEVVL